MINPVSGRFIGCDCDYEDCKIALFGAPFDGTASYRPGARFAGAAMRQESGSIETFSPFVQADLEEVGAASICDLGELELPFGNPSRVLDIVETRVGGIIDDVKIPVMIGGEHLVTLGAVRAAARVFPELRVIQFDAHADLRDDYLGEKLSHATVMRRCYELTGDGRIFQFGVRSGARDEFVFAGEHTRMNLYNFNGIEELDTGRYSKVPVYLTVDLDVLDPSEFPGTGTPEAGGVRYTELLNAACSVIRGGNVIGLDITELSPPLDPSGISVPLACKFLRELLLLLAAAAAAGQTVSS